MNSLSEAPTITASFVIGSNELDPEMCTRELGLEPTEIWRQERTHLLSISEVPNTQWIISTGKITSDCVELPLAKLLEVIWPQRDQIVQFLAENQAECFVSCDVTITCDRPLFEVSVDSLLKMGTIGASFRMDIFDYTD
jgi:hypothetical protein